MSKEAALILGGVAALVNGIVTVAGLGAFDDGLQLVDLIPILGPVLAALGIRASVWSQESVQEALNQQGTTIKTTTKVPRDPDTYSQGGKGPG